MLHQIIRSTFYNHLGERDDVSKDLIESVKNNERVELFLTNLCKTMAEVDIGYRKKLGKNLKKEQIIEITRDFTNNFVNSVKLYAEENAMSIAKKVRLQEKAQKLKDMETAVASGKLEGEFADLEGIVKINGTDKEKNKEEGL